MEGIHVMFAWFFTVPHADTLSERSGTVMNTRQFFSSSAVAEHLTDRGNWNSRRSEWVQGTYRGMEASLSLQMRLFSLLHLDVSFSATGVNVCILTVAPWRTEAKLILQTIDTITATAITIPLHCLQRRWSWDASRWVKLNWNALWLAVRM